MGLKDKAAKVNLSDLDADPMPSGAAGTITSGPDVLSSPVATKPLRTGVGAISQTISLHHRVQHLERELATFEDASMVVKLDPKQVRQSRWKNRHEAAFSTAAFSELKEQLSVTGGNTVPIKVRRLQPQAGSPVEYEVVYGRRRLRACLELGLPVSAIVESLSEQELFAQMDRENRDREDLSAWEKGCMYKHALDDGLFPSARRLADALGLDFSNVARAIRLASLPASIIDAFPSPIEIQWRWALSLVEAMEKDPERILNTAQSLSASTERLPAKEVFARLVGSNLKKAASGEKTTVDLRSAKGAKVGSFARDDRGSVTLKMAAGAMSAGQEKKLLDFVAKLLA
jgi:ParB family chromosome partitioning protein